MAGAPVEAKTIGNLEADIAVLEEHNDSLEDELTILQRQMRDLRRDLDSAQDSRRKLADQVSEMRRAAKSVGLVLPPAEAK